MEAIYKELKKINYPNLEKNILELGVVEVEKAGNNYLITLNVANKEAYVAIEKAIKKRLSHLQPTIRPKHQKRDIHYGTTTNPNNRAPYAKHVIAVTSGKGGVGKSTISANLSIALAQKGYSVGLLDADLYGPDIPRLLGVAHERIRWEGEKMVPATNYGIKIMSVGLTIPSSDTPLVWRSSVAVSALIQLLEDVEWGELDFLVIDMPPGTGDIQLTIAQELPISAGVIVTTPQMVAMEDVSKAIRMFQEIGVHIGGIVENMSYFLAPDTQKRYDIFGKDGGKALAKSYSIPFLGEIPLLMPIREASDMGRPPAAHDQTIRPYYQTIASNLLANLKRDS